MTQQAPTGLIGQMVGNYRILELVGEGGMGTVFRAEHVVMGRRAAVKVLRPELVADEQLVARFVAEARAVNEIDHPALVDVFDVGRLDDGRLYMVMEFLEGETLAGRMRAGPMLARAAVGVVLEVARALGAAHEKGFVHRDVKPENIFLAQYGRGPVVKLLDFGIAKLAGVEAAMDRLTRTGAVIGTPTYMSPEQIEGAAVDGRADIYSLAVVFYELLAGEPPFEGKTLGEVLKAHLIVEAPPVHELAPAGVPEGLSKVVARALRKDPDQRYPNMGAFTAAIEAALAGKDPEEGFMAQAVGREGGSSADDVHTVFEPVVADLPTQPGRRPAPAQTPQAGTPTAPATGTARRATRAKKTKKGLPVGVVVAVVAVAAVSGFLLINALKNSGDSPATAKTGSRAPHTADPTPGPVEPPGPDLPELRDRAVGMLAGAARSGEPSDRARALRKLGNAGDSSAADLALTALRTTDEDPQVQMAAAWALGALKHDDAADDLVALADRSEGVVRVWAAEALLKMGDERGRKLLRASLKSPDLSVAMKAAVTLAEDRDDAARKPLKKLLASDSALRRSFAIPLIGALARLGDDDAGEELRAMLAEDDEITRLGSAEALAHGGDDAGADVLKAIALDDESLNRALAAHILIGLGEPVGGEVLAAIAEQPEDPGYMVALEALGELGDPTAAGALAKALDDDDREIALAAASGILLLVGATPDARESRSIDWVEVALAADDWKTRDAAASVLAELDPEVAVPLLGRAIGDDDAKVRRSAARALGKTGSSDAVPILVSVLSDAAEEVVAEAAAALGDIGDKSAVPRLKEIASAVTVAGIEASGSLLQLGDKGAVANLAEAVAGDNRDLRRSAVAAAGRSRSADVVPVLKTATADEDLEIRVRAATALAMFGDASGAEVLREALDDKGMAPEAYAALRSLGLEVEESRKPSLAERLTDDDMDVRRDAIFAARELPAKELVPLVRRALRDDEVLVRLVALDVLSDAEDVPKKDLIALYRMAERDGASGVSIRATAALSRLLAPPPPPKPAPRPAERPPATAAPAGIDSGTDAGTDSAVATAAPETAAPVTAAPPRTAEVYDEASDADEARSHATRGRVLLGGGKYKAAIKELKAAEALVPIPGLQFDLAEAHRREALRMTDPGKRAKLLEKSLKHYTRYLREGASGSRAARARAYLKEVSDRLKELE